MKAKFEELIESFITGRVGICEEFLSLSLCAVLQQNLIDLNNDRLLLPANIGNNVAKDKNQIIRSDKTRWLEKDSSNLAEMEFLEIIQHFIWYLNKTCFTHIHSCEFHYALYEVGTYYKKHKDQFRNNNNREFSFITYLNNDWLEAEGGQLIIYNEENNLEILPTNRKSIFFKSADTEHAVAIANRRRMSITGWLKNE